MLPLALFRSRQFSRRQRRHPAVYAALGGRCFCSSSICRRCSGYGPLEAGTALLPITVLMLLLAARFGALGAADRAAAADDGRPAGDRRRLVLLTRLGAGRRYLADVLPAVVVFGLGLAMFVAPLTATVLAAAPAARCRHRLRRQQRGRPRRRAARCRRAAGDRRADRRRLQRSRPISDIVPARHVDLCRAAARRRPLVRPRDPRRAPRRSSGQDTHRPRGLDRPGRRSSSLRTRPPYRPTSDPGASVS